MYSEGCRLAFVHPTPTLKSQETWLGSSGSSRHQSEVTKGQGVARRPWRSEDPCINEFQGVCSEFQNSSREVLEEPD